MRYWNTRARSGPWRSIEGSHAITACASHGTSRNSNASLPGIRVSFGTVDPAFSFTASSSSGKDSTGPRGGHRSRDGDRYAGGSNRRDRANTRPVFQTEFGSGKNERYLVVIPEAGVGAAPRNRMGVTGKRTSSTNRAGVFYDRYQGHRNL